MSCRRRTRNRARSAPHFRFSGERRFSLVNVHENVGFGLRKQTRAQRDQTIARYIDMVSLAGFENAYPHELSGGCAARRDRARARGNPDIIYMDEPFGALDFLTRLKMRTDLVRIWQSERKPFSSLRTTLKKPCSSPIAFSS